MERGAAPGAEASMLERAGNPTPRPILDVHNVKERGATGTVSCANEALAKSTRTHARAQGTRMDSGCSAGRDAGHLSLLPTRRREGALRRLFRFCYRALFGPTIDPGGAQIRRARAHELPVVRSIRPSGGGAERGGDM